DINQGIKVIDFGNAIHCVYDELALYYDDYELQTIVYRAPEVICGLPFGTEIDLWSVGCILAEPELVCQTHQDRDSLDPLQSSTFVAV
ncbi:putative homeodomain-interacting protein kinase 3, partial [Apostichopus japonicus]